MVIIAIRHESHKMGNDRANIKTGRQVRAVGVPTSERQKNRRRS